MVDARNRIVAVLKPMFAWVREHPVLCLLVGLLVGLLAVFGAVMASGAPEWAYGLFGAGEKFRVLEFLGVAMGGVLLAIGATIAHKRAVALEDAAEAQAGAAAAQADANKGAEDGRRQERLKNAIEHLGHASDSVRLGGAYELFHLAQDTEDLRQMVMDILCAHIRRTTGEDGYREKHKAKPSEEIQSLLTLLFVREYEVFKGCRIDLQGSWLNGAVLVKAHLEEANLARAHLRKAYFGYAYLQGSRLYESCMQGADFQNAYLQGSRLDRAQMQGAGLLFTQMQGTVLIRAQMQGAYMSRTELQGAIFVEVKLQGAGYNTYSQLRSFAENIRKTVGEETDLSEVVLQGGLSQKDVDFLIEGLPDWKEKLSDMGGALIGKGTGLRMTLNDHIDKPASNELPEGRGAIIGAYTAEEADRWIAEYEEAMGERPEAGEG